MTSVFEPFNGNLPQVSDFGRVMTWGGADSGVRRKPRVGRSNCYSCVAIRGYNYPVADLVLNAFEGEPEEEQTAVSALCQAMSGCDAASV